MLRALITSLAVTLLLGFAPSPALGQDQDLPRRRPRITDPADDEDSGSSGKPKSGRDHAIPIESDDSGWETGEKSPAPSPKPAEEEPTPRTTEASAVEERPAPEPAEEGLDEPPRRSRAPDEQDDLRDDLRDDRPASRPRRSTRTAEEELREDEARPRRLANRDEPGYGLAAELNLGAIFLHDAVEGSRATFAWGLGFTWQLGRMFAPENKLLHKGLFLEAAWLHPLSSTEGTDAVKISSSQHDLWLAVLFGYPFKNALVYGKFGPAMYVQPVGYDVQGTVTEWSGVKGGVLYGLGARTTLYLNQDFGIAARLELTRFRRGYLDDTLLSAGLGATF